MIVADTCIVVHLFNATHLTEIAQRVLEKDPQWILPPIWKEEYANVISKLARKENKPADEIIKHFIRTKKELNDFEYDIELEDALRISIEQKISVYDAHFITLAEKFGTVLVTEDKEVLKRCPHQSLSMADFLKD
jgi:predicted nucleic acid-binding protein